MEFGNVTIPHAVKSSGGGVGFVYFCLQPAHLDKLPLMKCRLNTREVLLPGDICVHVRGGGPNDMSGDVLP